MDHLVTAGTGWQAEVDDWRPASDVHIQVDRYGTLHPTGHQRRQPPRHASGSTRVLDRRDGAFVQPARHWATADRDGAAMLASCMRAGRTIFTLPLKAVQ